MTPADFDAALQRVRTAEVSYPRHRGAADPPLGAVVSLVKAHDSTVHPVALVYRPGYSQPWASEDERELFERAARWRRGDISIDQVRRMLVRFLTPPTNMWWSTPWPSQLRWPDHPGIAAAQAKAAVQQGDQLRKVPGGWRWVCWPCWDTGRRVSGAGIQAKLADAERALRDHVCQT